MPKQGSALLGKSLEISREQVGDVDLFAANVAAFLTAVLAVAENHDMVLCNRNSSMAVPAPAVAVRHRSPLGLVPKGTRLQPACAFETSTTSLLQHDAGPRPGYPGDLQGRILRAALTPPLLKATNAVTPSFCHAKLCTTSGSRQAKPVSGSTLEEGKELALWLMP
jgi:hypothetical protein